MKNYFFGRFFPLSPIRFVFSYAQKAKLIQNGIPLGTSWLYRERGI
jgi:hypothetical protein